MTTTDAMAAGGKYLTLLLNEAVYGIAMDKVCEIVHAGIIMPLPQFSRHIRGVVNVRGRIIPVMDLRSRLGLVWQSQERSCIVIVQVHGYGDTPVMIGLSVDAVDDVQNFAAGQITPVSIFHGTATLDGGSVTLLDIDRVVAPELAPIPR